MSLSWPFIRIKRSYMEYCAINDELQQVLSKLIGLKRPFRAVKWSFTTVYTYSGTRTESMLDELSEGLLDGLRRRGAASRIVLFLQAVAARR